MTNKIPYTDAKEIILAAIAAGTIKFPGAEKAREHFDEALAKAQADPNLTSIWQRMDSVSEDCAKLGAYDGAYISGMIKAIMKADLS